MHTMNLAPLRLLAPAFCAALAATPALAQSFASLGKQARFVQTGPATVVPDTSGEGAFKFGAFVDSSTATLAPTFTPPNGTPRSLAFDAGDGEWGFEQSFASQAALTAAFPNGTYTYTIGGRAVSLPFTGDLFPNAPVATLSQGTFNNGALVVDRTQPLTITIAFTQNYLAGRSHLGIDVNGGGPGGSFLDLGTSNEASNFTQTPLSFTVPANTFAAGGNYRIELSADRIVTLDTTSVAGFTVVSVYTSQVTINVNTGTGPVPGVAPTIIAQPVSKSVAASNTVVFTAIVNGASNFQWRLNGAPIAGANRPTLVLSGPNVVAGRYSLFASNPSGNVTSSEATLTVLNTTDVGRLINLSILTPLDAGESMTMGTVLGGDGTVGTKPLLARAAGPSLAQLGVTGFLPDPSMTLVNISSGTTVGTNNGWGGSTALSTAFSAVGAFPYVSASSRDSAMFQPSLPAANYTVQVRSDAGTGTGTMIAELYDSTPSTSFNASTPRLINVSVLKQITSSLTAGFVIGGSSAKTVLVRAVGPRLGIAPFNISGVMPAPNMTLTNISTNTVVARNSGWGGDPQILNVGNRVGAFAVTDPASRDAMVLVTLFPGNYTAEVSPSSGTTGGTAIVEVYEVP